MVPFRRWYFALLLTLIAHAGEAQVWQSLMGYVNGLVNDTTGFEQRTLLIYPTLTVSPETQLEVGASGNILLTLGGDTATTRYSNIVPQVFVTLRGQYGFRMTNELFFPHERYLVIGEARVQEFPMLYFGVGPRTQEAAEVQLHQFQVVVRQRFQRRVAPNWFAGAGLEYHSIGRLYVQDPPVPAPVLPSTVRGGGALGIGPAVTYEGRENPLNPRQGTYLSANYLFFREWLGANSVLDLQQLDLRHYVAVATHRPRPHVLALQALYVRELGDAPYNLQPMLGGEMMLRGWYLGRFRDKVMWGHQVEFRYNRLPGLPRWGLTAFAAAGGVAPSLDAITLPDLKTSAGGGVRFLLFQTKDIQLRADVGVTREGANFYVGLGEAF